MPRSTDPTPEQIAARGREQQRLTLKMKGAKPDVPPKANGKVRPCKNQQCRKARTSAEAFSYGEEGPCEDCWAWAQQRLG